jgi:hypothetical protein
MSLYTPDIWRTNRQHFIINWSLMTLSIIFQLYCGSQFYCMEDTRLCEENHNQLQARQTESHQGSPNQAKWATFSPWFQWNCPISVKKRSFSLFKSVFFSSIIIFFLQYSRKRSSHVPEIWPIQGLTFNILFQIR